MSDQPHNPPASRAELVERWQEITTRLAMASGPERLCLIEQLRQVESAAVRLILREHGVNDAA